ncbi:MAG: class D sortase [Clostridia bacterium]|nr:class D sortase [Clostridia bacterium]
MFKFTKTGVFVLSVIIIFCFIQIFIYKYPIETEINEEIMKTIGQPDIPVIETTEKCEIWQIEIPEISLIADISEGTTKEVLNKHVGHFEKTAKEEGNVGLAAHNRGYEVNYFKDLKLLKKGDEIIYKHNKFEKIYQVDKCRIIKDTEWEYLEQTEENILTLITCVENQPEYRRCIQAVEKEEEIY